MTVEQSRLLFEHMIFKFGVFPNKESLLRIASALLIELDESWLAEDKVYLGS